MTLVALSLLAACGSDATSSTDTIRANLPGTYALVSVSGAPLPMVVQAANPKIELISEQLVVNAGGTFSIATNRRTTTSAGLVSVATTNDAGTYNTSGSGISFHFNSGNTVSATLSGNTLTLIAPTSSSVYMK